MTCFSERRPGLLYLIFSQQKISPDAETRSSVMESAASTKGDDPVASSGTYAFEAWVRYPTEYSEMTGSMAGRKDLISDSMITANRLSAQQTSLARFPFYTAIRNLH
ncbi:unnamed protein product [Diplocarpon coronariae]